MEELGKNGEEKNEKTPIRFSKEDKLKRLKERRKRKGSRKKKIVLTIVALFIALIGFFGFKVWSMLDQIFAGSGLAPGLLGDLGSSELKGEGSGRVNILLMGMGGKDHAGGSLTDTNIIVSIDPRKNDVAMLSVPRDLYVNVPGHGFRKINEAHAIGESEKYSGGGPALAKETFSKVLDIPIHYYARLDFEGFRKIIDTVGGVDIDVEKDIYDNDYPVEKKGDSPVYSVKKGKHHMDGNAALKYARSRHSTSDFDRAKRQQQLMMAVKDKVISTETIFNPVKVSNIMSTLGANMKTDFSLKDMKKLYAIGKKVDSGKVISRVLDTGETGLLVGTMENGASILKPKSGDWDEIRDFVKNIFADSYIKDESASITIYDASGKYGMGDKLSKKLKALGYDVSAVVKEKSTVSVTKLYDFTGGKKPYTVKYLEGKIDVKAETKTKTADDEEIDISLVLGKDYVE